MMGACLIGYRVSKRIDDHMDKLRRRDGNFKALKTEALKQDSTMATQPEGTSTPGFPS